MCHTQLHWLKRHLVIFASPMIFGSQQASAITFNSHLILYILLLLGTEDLHCSHQPHHQLIHCRVT